jgi:prepilin-type N-terminal cleavage/methylation domain-containing protein
MQTIRTKFRRTPRRRPGGFTLVEMLLVLAVLMMMAGLVWPSVTRLYSEHSLRQAAEGVRVRLTAARVNAIATGIAYQFRFEPSGRRFVVLPVSSDDAAGTPGQSTRPAWKVSGALPYKVQFELPLNPQAAATIPVQPLPQDLFAGLPDGAQLASVNWSPPVLFYPDGSADNFVLGFVDQRQQTVQLTIRGLTAAVTLGKVQRKLR